jgi:hypothetical protein
VLVSRLTTGLSHGGLSLFKEALSYKWNEVSLASSDLNLKVIVGC